MADPVLNPLGYIGGIVLVLLLTVAPTARANDPPGVVQSASLQKRLQAALAAKGSDYQPRTDHLHPDGSPLYTNRLILEDSPYLLQHAHNPVDWYAWGPAAFARARAENKPIFLSIGYSTCHWCHVMERESFDDPEVAQFLNEHFVAIKVDRERRPDIDTIYMTAVQLITGGGGWPMSSFLDLAGQTFYGGTYFPRAQFLDLLRRVEVAWREDRQGLEERAGRVEDEEHVLLARMFGERDFATADVGQAEVRCAISDLRCLRHASSLLLRLRTRVPGESVCAITRVRVSRPVVTLA